jgi:hypothetical protein
MVESARISRGNISPSGTLDPIRVRRHCLSGRLRSRKEPLAHSPRTAPTAPSTPDVERVIRTFTSRTSRSDSVALPRCWLLESLGQRPAARDVRSRSAMTRDSRGRERWGRRTSPMPDHASEAFDEANRVAHHTRLHVRRVHPRSLRGHWQDDRRNRVDDSPSLGLSPRH